MDTLAKIRSELAGYGYVDYLKHLAAAREANSDGAPLRIAVLRSYTVEAIEPVLELRLHLEGYRSEFFFGGFNQYVQEILDPSSELYAFDPHVVLLLVRVEELMPDFAEEFGASGTEWGPYVESKAHELARLAGTLRENSSAQLIVQGLGAPTSAYWGIYDAQMPAGQAFLVSRFNDLLAAELSGLAGAYIWDFDGFLRRVGFEQVFDPKMFYLSRNPFRQSAYPALADDLLRYLLSVVGRSKKCIVLDLDNTLWGGVIGEDGMEGIELGHTYPGLCFREFQKGLLRLYHRGVILAVNSKNNESDALRVIDEHPDMVLRRKHFAAMEINWTDKVSNLRTLAETLNIGIDSMVMVDDNPVECEFIQQSLPECAVVCLPQQPYLLPAVVDRFPGVENIRLTDEDRKKGAMYQAQAARKKQESAYASLDEFLESLALEVTIEPASQFSVPRIAQLTQKTNQLNVTTRRYTEADIEAFAADESTSVYSVSVKDKFGDNGIVGVMIARYEGEECRIDTLLLSCRVIGRNIEAAMLAFLAGAARERGVRVLVGEFLPTAKNAPAADLFPRLGFDARDDSVFTADLRAKDLGIPPYIRLVTVGDG